jgi:SAM-dependent methyltransferase
VYLENPPTVDPDLDSYHGRPDPDPGAYQPDGADPFLSFLFRLNDERIRVLRRFCPTGNLLDVGCGRGYFVKTASEWGFDAMGIDASGTAVRYAGKELGVRAEHQDLDGLVRTGKRFDAVTLWHVLEHFTDPVGELRRIRSLLKEGGFCLVETPNLNSLKFMLSRRKWRGGNHPLYHRTFFTSKTLRKTLERAGYAGVLQIRVDYPSSGRKRTLSIIKRMLNRLDLDSFIDYAVKT